MRQGYKVPAASLQGKVGKSHYLLRAFYVLATAPGSSSFHFLKQLHEDSAVSKLKLSRKRLREAACIALPTVKHLQIHVLKVGRVLPAVGSLRQPFRSLRPLYSPNWREAENRKLEKSSSAYF